MTPILCSYPPPEGSKANTPMREGYIIGFVVISDVAHAVIRPMGRKDTLKTYPLSRVLVL